MVNILIIDDNIKLCKVMSRNLKRDDMNVSCVHSLADGAKTALKGGFDIIFLDLNLPDGEGLDLLPRASGGLS